MFSPIAFFGTSSRGKSGDRAGVAKGKSGQRHAQQVASQSASQGALQVAQAGPLHGSTQAPLHFDSPPAIPLIKFQNQLGRIGSKPNLDVPMSKFLPTPLSTLFGKDAQMYFQRQCDEQEMALRRSIRIQNQNQNQDDPVSQSNRQRLARKIVKTVMEGMEGFTALKSCFQESFDKDPFMENLIKQAKLIRKFSKK